MPPCVLFSRIYRENGENKIKHKTFSVFSDKTGPKRLVLGVLQYLGISICILSPKDMRTY